MMGNYVHLAFSLVNSDGQYDHVAIPLRRASVAPMAFDGDAPKLHLDIVHMDGEKERIDLVIARTYYSFGNYTGNSGIGDFQICPYSSATVLTKEQWREKIGTGRLLNDRGHFCTAQELKEE